MNYIEREFTEEEADFANAVAEFMAAMFNVQQCAQRVTETGGNARDAFLSTIPEEQRSVAQLQWPMVAMMLGVPV